MPLAPVSAMAVSWEVSGVELGCTMSTETWGVGWVVNRELSGVGLKLSGVVVGKVKGSV